MDRLDSHHLDYSTRDTKVELLDIAFQNAPKEKYVVDEAARMYGVQILRLPIKHCSLNSIELAWASMKSYVRDNNTHFHLTDLERLASEWIAALDQCTATSYFSHAEQHELVFKQADTYAEELEEDLVDEDDEANFSGDETDRDVDE